MTASVPMVPFFLLTGFFVALGMYGFYLIDPLFPLFLLLIYFPIYYYMRIITKKDDQRLAQVLLRMRLRLRMRAAKAQWGAVTYAPLKYRDRKRNRGNNEN